jgi:hypothetical protein
MKLPNFIKSLSPLEITLTVLFVLYIILPINAPQVIAKIVDTQMGMLAIFLLAVYLYVNTHPVIAVLFIFVAYELFRRCCLTNTGSVIMIKNLPTQKKKDAKMKEMNPIKSETLEEEVVEHMAPVGKSNVSEYMATGFSPIAENVNGASVY